MLRPRSFLGRFQNLLEGAAEPLEAGADEIRVVERLRQLLVDPTQGGPSPTPLIVARDGQLDEHRTAVPGIRGPPSMPARLEALPAARTNIRS